jgi:hypothetical protein
MTPEERTQRLKDLMAQYKLKAKDVGKILDISAQSVRVYRSKYAQRNITANNLRLLELELERRARAKENG